MSSDLAVIYLRHKKRVAKTSSSAQWAWDPIHTAFKSLTGFHASLPLLIAMSCTRSCSDR